MKTPIENVIDELLDIRQHYFSQNQVATDTLDGILKILTKAFVSLISEVALVFISFNFDNTFFVILSSDLSVSSIKSIFLNSILINTK